MNVGRLVNRTGFWGALIEAVESPVMVYSTAWLGPLWKQKHAERSCAQEQWSDRSGEVSTAAETRLPLQYGSAASTRNYLAESFLFW